MKKIRFLNKNKYNKPYIPDTIDEKTIAYPQNRNDIAERRIIIASIAGSEILADLIFQKLRQLQLI